MSLPKRRILSPTIPGSRTPEEFRRAVEEVSERRGKGSDPIKVVYDVEPKKKTGGRSTVQSPRQH